MATRTKTIKTTTAPTSSISSIWSRAITKNSEWEEKVSWKSRVNLIVHFTLKCFMVYQSNLIFLNPFLSSGWLPGRHLLVQAGAWHLHGCHLGHLPTERNRRTGSVSPSGQSPGDPSNPSLSFQVRRHQQWGCIPVCRQLPGYRWGGVWRRMGADEGRIHDLFRRVPSDVDYFLHWAALWHPDTGQGPLNLSLELSSVVVCARV